MVEESKRQQPMECLKECPCTGEHDKTRLIVVTGGPGAGKTAVLEIIRKELCEHVVILPEAASVVFGGGFWRMESTSAQRAAQKAILAIQQQMESLVLGERKWALGLCDRGVPDGLAYWPGEEQDFWRAAGSSLKEEYEKYFSVIHLRTPTEQMGYNYQNPLRIETAAKAAEIDERIHDIWSDHPRYIMVESTKDFFIKAERAITYITDHMPDCCAQALENK